MDTCPWTEKDADHCSAADINTGDMTKDVPHIAWHCELEVARGVFSKEVVNGEVYYRLVGA